MWTSAEREKCAPTRKITYDIGWNKNLAFWTFDIDVILIAFSGSPVQQTGILFYRATLVLMMFTRTYWASKIGQFRPNDTLTVKLSPHRAAPSIHSDLHFGDVLLVGSQESVSLENVGKVAIHASEWIGVFSKIFPELFPASPGAQLQEITS